MSRTIQIDLPMEAIAALCERYQVRELSLFGSVVRDDFRPDSDVDFLVTFKDDSELTFYEFVEMKDELATLVGRPVDLVEEKALTNPFRRKTILRDKTVIYERAESPLLSRCPKTT
jgi:uncharacterized protein